MDTFHSSTYRPTVKERTDLKGWYVLFELNEETGIPAVDSGDRQVAIMLPDGGSEDDARALQKALHIKGAKLALIE